MRISALGGAWLLVLGLLTLSGTLYYDQANVATWTTYPSLDTAAGASLNGPVEAATNQAFSLIGAIASGAVAALVAICALLFGTGRRVGHWALRVTSVLVFVLLALTAVAVIVSVVTEDEPAAMIATPSWLVTAEWISAVVALVGAGITTGSLWDLAPEA